MNAAQEGGEKQVKKNTEVEQALMKELRELKTEVTVVQGESSSPAPSSTSPHTTAV